MVSVIDVFDFPAIDFTEHGGKDMVTQTLVTEVGDAAQPDRPKYASIGVDVSA